MTDYHACEVMFFIALHNWLHHTIDDSKQTGVTRNKWHEWPTRVQIKEYWHSMGRLKHTHRVLNCTAGL